MSKKYELTNESITLDTDTTLYQIRRLSDGVLGGFVESEANLSHEGNCWIYGNAQVFGKANVYGNVRVFDSARIFGDARIYGNARISDKAQVFGNARISSNAQVYGYARISDKARISGYARISGDAWVFGDARIYGNAQVSGNARVFGSPVLQEPDDCLTVTGLQFHVTALPESMVIGCQCRTYQKWSEVTLEQAVEMELDSKNYETFMVLVRGFGNKFGQL